jgi:hypothetical protein
MCLALISAIEFSSVFGTPWNHDSHRLRKTIPVDREIVIVYTLQIGSWIQAGIRNFGTL